MQFYDIIIIGGGAAGFMAAICAAERAPHKKILILERGKEVLTKVKISGGGRCNVTHNCPDPELLARNYPRGSRALIGVFSRFGQAETVEWFKEKGVRLKAEKDGRMFPVTDDSQTIINCLVQSAQKNKVEIKKGCRVQTFEKTEEQTWEITLTHEPPVFCNDLMIATGSNPSVWSQIAGLGHTIIPPVPSLFTFNIKDERLKDLPGISFEKVGLKISAPQISDKKLIREINAVEAEGSLLITHWGLSGFGILKLSAWGARIFHRLNYHFLVHVNFLPQMPQDAVAEKLAALKKEWAKKQVGNLSPFDEIPNRFWKRICTCTLENEHKNWGDLSKKEMYDLQNQLVNASFQVTGKSTFKDEFVTAGGVDLKEVNFQTFESKIIPRLYFAGEVLDIDALTGGFNFQAAWSGGWHAGVAMAQN